MIEIIPLPILGHNIKFIAMNPFGWRNLRLALGTGRWVPRYQSRPPCISVSAWEGVR